MTQQPILITRQLTEAQLADAYETIRGTYWGHAATPESFATQNRNTQLHIILQADEPAGYFRILTDGVHIAYLMDLVIKQDRRNEGIGSEALDWIRREYAPMKILLLSSRAQPFYLAHGFEPVEASMNYFVCRPVSAGPDADTKQS